MADTEYYENLRSNPPEKPKKEGHKGNWSLIFELMGKQTVVVSDKPYQVCVAEKKKLEVTPRVAKGALRIVPFRA